MNKRVESIRQPVIDEEDAILLTRDDKAYHAEITDELWVIEGSKGELVRKFQLVDPILVVKKTAATLDTEKRLARAQELLKKRMEEEMSGEPPVKVS